MVANVVLLLSSPPGLTHLLTSQAKPSLACGSARWTTCGTPSTLFDLARPFSTLFPPTRSWGKPQGWGGPWRNDTCSVGVPSDPFLMTGFDKKVGVWWRGTNISSTLPPAARPILGRARHRVETNERRNPSGLYGRCWAHAWRRLGHGEYYTWSQSIVSALKHQSRLQMGSIDVAAAGSSSYGFYVFPTGFSAHWVRLVTDTTTTCTAIFHYT